MLVFFFKVKKPKMKNLLNMVHFCVKSKREVHHKEFDVSQRGKIRVATMTHNHDDTPDAILTIFVVSAGK